MHMLEENIYLMCFFTLLLLKFGVLYSLMASTYIVFKKKGQMAYQTMCIS